MFYINAIFAGESGITADEHTKVPNKQNVKHMSVRFFTDNYFLFLMHKKLSAVRRLLLKLAEDKTTGSMRYL
jgi:hypothetical protein